MSAVATKHIETEVKKQSALLGKAMPGLLKSPALKGKFVGFYDGQYTVAETHAECFASSEAKFAGKSFVIDEVTDKKLYVSALVLI